MYKTRSLALSGDQGRLPRGGGFSGRISQEEEEEDFLQVWKLKEDSPGEGNSFPTGAQLDFRLLPELPDTRHVGSHFPSLLQGPLLPQAETAASGLNQSFSQQNSPSVFPGVAVRYTPDIPLSKQWALGWQCPPMPDGII